MTKLDFTATLTVSQPPEEVFTAINNPRGWWSEEIQGETEKVNDVFDYHFEDIHRCRIKIKESIPNKKVVWHVLDNYFKPGIFNQPHESTDQQNPSNDHVEWVGTSVVFEIFEKYGKTEFRFTHLGLVPDYECFDVCSNGWNHYIRQSLLGLISSGKGMPNSKGIPMTSDEEKFHSMQS